ncbi:MAG: DegT/DnrJ/EryC1/StrS family aminotransferase [Bacteroidetes bacterium]|nr:DegT/DnrJ/EryC1/StrS family aminotransferase [Bacteroidota bacterium]
MIKLPENAKSFFRNNYEEIFNTGNLAESIWNEKLVEFGKVFCNAGCAVPTSSNGSGLVALMTIYRHYYGRDKVILQSNTMYGVKTMVLSAGCKLAGFAKCNIESLMPNLQQIQDAVNASKQAPENLILLLSHIGGIINPEIEKIATFCQAHNILLLEDCAHSFGATLNGKHSGTFGDSGVFSFYATKAIPAGEGGLVITNNHKIGDLVKRYVMYDRFAQEMNIGVNIRPSELQALCIYSVLLCTEEIIENKRQIATQYIHACEELQIPYIKQVTNNYSGNYYKFIVFSQNKPIGELLPKLKTTTSKVYDYALGDSSEIILHHACLPIWYNQEQEITSKVIKELYESV